MPGLNFEKSRKNISYLLKRKNYFKKNTMKIIINQVEYKGFDRNKEKNQCSKLFGNGYDYHVFGYLDRVGSNKEKNHLIINQLIDRKNVFLAGCSLNRIEQWMSITSNGEVTICSQDWKKEEVLGNIHENTIEEIFNGNDRKDLLRKIHEEIDSNPDFICSKCKLANLFINERFIQNEVI